jgi:hypothetical protein
MISGTMSKIGKRRKSRKIEDGIKKENEMKAGLGSRR